MISYEEKNAIQIMNKELAIKYPIEANYNSRASLWGRGIDDGSVTRELYNTAANFYGRLWHYVGD